MRIGLIGAGQRQASLVSSLAGVSGSQVMAVADPHGASVAEISGLLVDHGKPVPETYAGDDATDRPLARDHIDLALIATPWPSHTRLAIQALRAGKHVGLEVPAAITIEDCWELINTSE